MGRKDREIQDKKEIQRIMEACQVCSLAFSGTQDEYPYVIPLNFGVIWDGDQAALYFHGAGEGTKTERMRRDERAAFCMYSGQEPALKQPACRSTMLYSSVCGTGRLSVVRDMEEKRRGLDALMRQYDKTGAGFEYDDGALERITVLKLSVEEICGKSNRHSNDAVQKT